MNRITVVNDLDKPVDVTPGMLTSWNGKTTVIFPGGGRPFAVQSGKRLPRKLKKRLKRTFVLWVNR